MNKMFLSGKRPKVSIIIRTKNEEKWIGSCLRAVFEQSYTDFEVILVDNESTDATVKKALEYPIKVVQIEKFLPGKAINDGVKESVGDILVILSGHCIPVNDSWLACLVSEVEKSDIAGVYGRQEPLSFTSAFDKRDLAITFGLDKKLQVKDKFFHNANSALTRSVWESFPFDETVTNIEDRVWANQVINAGFKILYEPEARVYHYHGIHQGRNIKRAENIVRIMENLHGPHCSYDSLTLGKIRTVAIIPIKGDPLRIEGNFLLKYTIDYIKSCEHIDEIVVATDSEKTAKIARSCGASAPFLRPPRLSEPYIDLGEVLAFSIERIEAERGVMDLVAILEETHPFRPRGMLDEMIEQVVNTGLDTLIASFPESRKLWSEKNTGLTAIGETSLKPRELRESKMHLGLMGLSCITHAAHVRDGSLLGDKLGLYPIDSPLSSLEIRNKEIFEQCVPLLNGWTGTN